MGIDHDTARFAVEAIRRWWHKMGSKRYRNARRLLITADGGGSNGSRCRLWKVALQDLAAQLGLAIHVCHFPPGTSKWNKIVRRQLELWGGANKKLWGEGLGCGHRFRSTDRLPFRFGF